MTRSTNAFLAAILTVSLALLAGVADAATWYGNFGPNNDEILSDDAQARAAWNTAPDGTGASSGPLPVGASAGALDGNTWKHINHGVGASWFNMKAASGNTHFNGSVLEIDNGTTGDPNFKWNASAKLSGTIKTTSGALWIQGDGNFQSGATSGGFEPAGGTVRLAFNKSARWDTGVVTGSGAMLIDSGSEFSALTFAANSDFSGYTGTIDLTNGRIGWDGASDVDASGTTVELASGKKMTMGWGQRNSGSADGSNNTDKLATLNAAAGALDTRVILDTVSVDGTDLADGTYSWQDLHDNGYGDVFGMNIFHPGTNPTNLMGFLSATDIVSGGSVVLDDDENFINIDIESLINPNTEVLTVGSATGATPEPTSAGLLVLGLIGLVGFRRRRR